MSRAVIGAAAGLAAGAGAYFGASAMKKAYGENVLSRAWDAYTVALPAFVEYKFVQYRYETIPAKLSLPVDEAEVNAKYEALHDKWAPKMLHVIIALGGFQLKAGQLLASGFGDVAPRKWQEVFSPLLNDVPARSFEQVKGIVEAELGKPLDEVYSFFDPKPLAAASVAQVHRATLKADGRAVVVKVQYPEIEEVFRGDVAMCKAFAHALMPEHVPPLAEVERQFGTEFHFRGEAANIDLIRNNLKCVPAYQDVLVPEPIHSLCSKRVLTMTEIPNAIKLTTALQEDMTAFAASRGVSLDHLMEEERAANEKALREGCLRCGPDAATMEGYIKALKWRNSLAWVIGRKPTHIPRNHALLVDRLLEMHGHMALVDGAINGDPHPGNLLLSKDPKTGVERIGLVDFGQVKRLQPAERIGLSRLIVALARADEANPVHRKRVAELMQATGCTTAKNDPDVLFKMAQLYFDRDDKLVTGRRNIQAFIEDLSASDPVKTVGDDYVLVSRASMMLRGLGHLLNQHRSAARAWAPIAEKVLLEIGESPDAILPPLPASAQSSHFLPTPVPVGKAAAAPKSGESTKTAALQPALQ